MEPSEQSRAKIALGKADKIVHLTVSAAHRWARDVMRQVAQDNEAFYVAGESIFTDILLVIVTLLAFILVFLLGYFIGSCCARQVVHNTSKAVICDGGCQSAAAQKIPIISGGKQDVSLPADNVDGEQLTAGSDASKQLSVQDDSIKQSADDSVV